MSSGAIRTVFFGSGDIGLPALRLLFARPGSEVVGVVTQPDRPSGRGLQLTSCAIKELALSHGITPLQPARVRSAEAEAEIRSWAPDLFVVMAYGQILPQSLLDLPPLGALNLHASLLPRHRGAAPVHAAVLAGDERSGITVMWMDAGLDTGDILLSKECDLESDETSGTLHDRLAALAPEALEASLLLLREGRAPRIRQDESAASYAPKLSRASGRIDWGKSAAELERVVRGLHPWPGCTAVLETRTGRPVEIKVHRAAVSSNPADPGQLRLPCGGGGVLQLLEVQPSGGKRMGQAEFLRGHQILCGAAAGV